jgi:phthalate 4,5-dioxygenase oxygenase subunit
MLSEEQNDLLTLTGAGTAGGAFMRAYWQPVATSDDLPLGGRPLAVRVFGEDLVLFRDETGRPGLLAIHCAHRAADLSYGRVEDGGLRCLYHGWLFDIGGRCLEQPGEPADSTFKDRVRQRAYPCQEKGGLIFAYMGEGEPPLLPAYEFLDAPEENRWITQTIHNCNYQQANEGNFDPIHTSFLHKMFKEGEWTARKSKAVRGADMSPNELYGSDVAPRVELEETDFGLRIYSIRQVGPEKFYRRVTNLILPSLCAVPGQTGGEGYTINWYVPIDDTHHNKYRIMFSREGALDRSYFQQQDAKEIAPDHQMIRTAANRYLQDANEMNGLSFSGMGPNFQVQDSWAAESAGQIQDRTQERLGQSDRALIAVRRILLHAIQAVQDGHVAPHVVKTAEDNQMGHLIAVADIIASPDDWLLGPKEPVTA